MCFCLFCFLFLLYHFILFFHKRDNFCDFQFAFLHTKLLLKHYENTPIQIYRKFHRKKTTTKKTESFQIKNPIFFFISAQNIDCGNSLELPRRGGSNEYLTIYFLSRNKKNNVYHCKPTFYCIKVGFKELKLSRCVFVMKGNSR